MEKIGLIFQLFAPLIVGGAFFYITMVIGIFVTSALTSIMAPGVAISDDDGI